MIGQNTPIFKTCNLAYIGIPVNVNKGICSSRRKLITVKWDIQNPAAAFYDTSIRSHKYTKPGNLQIYQIKHQEARSNCINPQNHARIASFSQTCYRCNTDPTDPPIINVGYVRMWSTYLNMASWPTTLLGSCKPPFLWLKA